MTEKEAIEALKLEGGLKISGKHKRITRFLNGLEVAENALEKQIPKKVMNVRKSKCVEDVEYNGPDTLYGECPFCGELNNNLFNSSCCGDCGQKLNWSEENEQS